jgi:alpha-glucoside transport system permease protein
MWRPLLRRTVAIVFALVALATARTFDLILVMTPGSTVDDSAVLAVRIWQTSGGVTSRPAAALGVLWLAAVAVGAVGAALGSRQAWPPPEQPRDPADAERLRLLRGPVTSLPRRALPLVAALIWAIPVVGLIATSLHSPADAATRGWWAAPLDAGSYRTILDRGVLGSLGFTGLLALTVTAVVLGLALPAGYALAWLLPPGTPLAGLPLMAAAVVPVQVVAGPINEVLSVLRLSGTPVGLGLVHVALGLPFAVLVVRNGLADVPAEQVRRARLAGRREATMPWRLARSAQPALVAVAVLEFVQVWNDFAVGLLFSGAQAQPLGLLLFGQARQFLVTAGPLAAGCVLAAILPLVLVILTRREVVHGLVSGAVSERKTPGRRERLVDRYRR